MLNKRLVAEVSDFLKIYVAKFPSRFDIPADRKRELEKISYILLENNSITICKKLNELVDNLKLPLFSWFTFIDINDFYWGLKSILRKEAYLEINLLRDRVEEQEQIINNLRIQLDVKQEDTVKDKIIELAEEIHLLQNENKYLYSNLISLDKKIGVLESECKQNFQRAVAAEEKLQNFQIKYEHVIKFNNGLNKRSLVSEEDYSGAPQSSLPKPGVGTYW